MNIAVCLSHGEHLRRQVNDHRERDHRGIGTRQVARASADVENVLFRLTRHVAKNPAQ